MNNIVQVKCSLELPLKAQVIFGELIPFRKRGIRIRIVMSIYITSRVSYLFFVLFCLFSGRGEVLDLDDSMKSGSSQ